MADDSKLHISSYIYLLSAICNQFLILALEVRYRCIWQLGLTPTKYAILSLNKDLTDYYKYNIIFISAYLYYYIDTVKIDNYNQFNNLGILDRIEKSIEIFRNLISS